MSDYVIGFVSGMEVALPFMDSVIQAVQRDGCGVISVMGGPVIHRNRNQLAELWLGGVGGEHTTRMVMVDADIVFTLEDLDQLLAHTEPVVSGVYANQVGEPVTQGCGFMVIDKEVFKTLGEFPFNPIKTVDGRVSGEDVGFRVHCKEHGIPVLLDDTIQVGHIKPQILWVEGKIPDSEKETAAALISVG